MNHRKNAHVELLSGLNSYIENLIEQKRYFQEKLNNWNKDEEISKLKNENDLLRLRSVHVLSSKEEAELKEFRNNHYTSCKGSTKEIISHTGIGSGIIVVCTKCGTEKDITDVSSW